MDFQSTFNIVVGACGFLIAWWMKAVWDSMRELRAAHQDLELRAQKVEVKLAEKYITREELAKRLDKLEDCINDLRERLIDALQTKPQG